METKRRRPQREKTRRRIAKENCAPGFGEALDFTCYTPTVLQSMLETWNREHPNDRIVANDWLGVWTHLLNKNKHCSSESCLLGGNTKLKQTVFSPAMPKSWNKNKNEWLDSNDILKVMKQYETAHPDFEFLGPSPSDYDAQDGVGCVWEELCKFDLAAWIRKGKTKFGVIFNLDPHTKGGSHWVAIFIHVKTQRIYFFDSTGARSTKRIRHFMDTVLQQSKALGTPFKMMQNYPVIHQRGNTECGIYALFFIIVMIQFGDDAGLFKNVFKNKLLSDKEIQKFRHIFFNRPKSS